MADEAAARRMPAAREPDVSRILIRRTGDGIGIYNPTRRSIPLILFLGVWLCGWSMGEYFALSQLFGGAPLAAAMFLLVWLAIWTVGGALALIVFFWQLFGVEKLFLLDAGAVVVERGFGPLTRRKVFLADGVTELAERDAGAPSRPLPPAAITFRHEGREHRFGLGLDRAETKAVLAVFGEFLERHRPAGTQPGAGRPAREQ